MMPFTAAPAERATNARNRLARTCAIAARAAGDGCGGAAATSPWPRKETTCPRRRARARARPARAGGRPRAGASPGDVELRAEEVRRVAPTRADEADGRPRRGRGRGRRRVARRRRPRSAAAAPPRPPPPPPSPSPRARAYSPSSAVVVAGGADEVRELHGQEVVEFELVEALERAQARHAQQGLGQAPGRPRLKVVLEGPHEAAVGRGGARAARVAAARAGAHVDAVELHRQVQVHVEGRGADDLHVPQRRHGPAARAASVARDRAASAASSSTQTWTQPSPSRAAASAER